MDTKLLNRFCFIAMLEGISSLILFFVAMPLKYLAHIPEPVKYFGWLHGVLFITYVIGAFLCWVKYKWSFGKAALVFFASLLPIIPFIIEKRLKKEAAAAQLSVAK